MGLCKGYPDPMEPNNLTKSPNDDLIPTRTKGPVGQWRVSILKNRHQRVEWRVCISKTRATRTRLELQNNPAKSYKTSQIQPDLNQIWRNLDQIQLNPSNFQQKKCKFQGGKNPVSGDIFQFPAILFFQISLPFLIPTTDSAQPTLAITENRTDRFF